MFLTTGVTVVCIDPFKMETGLGVVSRLWFEIGASALRSYCGGWVAPTLQRFNHRPFEHQVHARAASAGFIIV
jgi:hypothetical protein